MDLSTIRPRKPIEATEAAPHGPRFEAQIFGPASLLHSAFYNPTERLAASRAFNVFARLRERHRATGRRA